MVPDKPYGRMEKCSFEDLGIFLPAALVWEVVIPIRLAQFGSPKGGGFLYK